MPRENRKRGKKHKKQTDTENTNWEQHEDVQQAGPSWIVDPNPELGRGREADVDAPFGYVEPDVKAYFKTVDSRLREWQENDAAVGMELETDVNEERRLFLVAALTELSGKERQLATDPDCSNILERMAYSMDDFVKRVLFDRLAGSYEQLSRHRFGSHVVQTLLSVAKGTIEREAKGQFASAPDSEDAGVLVSLTQLILSLSNELLPLASSLLMDPFASHVLRALLALLCPTLDNYDEHSSSLLRSKKSAKYRAKQGPMKSVFVDDGDNVGSRGKGKHKATTSSPYPPEFDTAARRFMSNIRKEMNPNEIRALAANKVACPVLLLLLELESLQSDSNKSGSLMDSVSAGLITSCLETPEQKPEASDFVATLLRDPASSRLLERLVLLSPEHTFNMIWELYFEGKLAKLAVHPVANFVVARVIERSTEEQLSAILAELEGSWPKFIKNARLGVLKALVDRAAELKAACAEVLKSVLSAFGVTLENAKDSLISCVLHVKTLSECTELSKSGTVLAPSIQGSLLIQSLLNLPEPQNQIVTDSISSLPPEQLLALSHNPISSRIIDALLESPTVPARARRCLILAFQGQFPALVDDRVGSRVGERLWNAADPYLKEKIARILLPHESLLVGSRYGKFFVRGLNLYLLKRNPEEWKTAMVKAREKESPIVKPSANVARKEADSVAKDAKLHNKKRKRAERGEEDEIDALFTSALGGKQAKANLTLPTSEGHPMADKARSKTNPPDDKDLASVLGAIRSAPKELKEGKKPKRNKVPV